MSGRLRLTLALVGVTFVWGATFVVVKEAVDRLPVLVFNGWRFALAATALGLVTRSSLRGLAPRDVAAGAVLGTALAAGYALQTFGLVHTTAAKAGFITGMFVVLTPLFDALAARRAPGGAGAAAALLATGGLALLTLEGVTLPTLGDLLVLGSAAAFALHIVGLGTWSPGRPAGALATVQLAVAAVLHLLAAGAQDALGATVAWAPPDAYVWGALAFTAVFASAVAFTVQTAAQAVLPPTRTAIILTMEPVFAYLTAWLGVPLLLRAGMTGLDAETFGLRQLAGAAVILASMLWAELAAGPPADALAARETATVHERDGPGAGRGGAPGGSGR